MSYSLGNARPVLAPDPDAIERAAHAPPPRDFTPRRPTTQERLRRTWRAWTLQGNMESILPLFVYMGGGLMLLGAVAAKAMKKRRER